MILFLVFQMVSGTQGQTLCTELEGRKEEIFMIRSEAQARERIFERCKLQKIVLTSWDRNLIVRL